MAEPTHKELLESNKRKRGYHRGLITRIQRQFTAAQARHPRDVSLTDLDVWLADLDHQMKLHDELHCAIQDLLADDSDAREADQVECDTRFDAHDELKQLLTRHKQKITIWSHGSDLTDRLDRLQSSINTSSRFQSSLDALAREMSKLNVSSNSFREDEVIGPLLKQLMDGITAIRRDLEAAPEKPPPKDTSTTVAKPPRTAPVQIVFPKFDGDPLLWQSFETSFTTAVKTRAAGFSNPDLRSLLMEALQTDRSKQLVRCHADLDTPLEKLMASLREFYGRPQVIVPLLTKKMEKHTVADDSHQGLDSIIIDYLIPAKELLHVLDDSLSQFVAHRLIGIMSKSLKNDWDNHARGKITKPTWEDLDVFFREKLIQTSPDGPGATAKPSSASASLAPTSSIAPGPKKKPSIKCIACGDTHALMRCPTFTSYDVDKRNKLVRDKRSCVNCLSESHTCRSCQSKYLCKTCGGRHHTLLHKDRDSTYSSASSASSTSAGTFRVGVSFTAPHKHQSPSFPHTITVTMLHKGHTARARAILDTGASVSMMSEKLASLLELKRHPRRLVLSGSFTDLTSKYYVVSSISSHSMSFTSEPIQFTVVPKLKPVPGPANKNEILKLPELANSTLADPDLGGEVDIFIGNMDMDKCTQDGFIRFGGYKAIHTPFGLSVAGPLQSNLPVPTYFTSSAPDDLQENLARLWELDKVPEAPSHSPEDEETIQQFQDSYQRIDGRFSVSLPKIKQPKPLGDSRRQAIKRLAANERSLSAKDKLLAFNTVLHEYLDLGHAHIIPNDQLSNQPHFYLPVHGVFKDSSSTTKIRAVFDASAKSSTGTSLNDTLVPGPNLYPPLQDVLIRFRRHKVGLSADISKMFREILLNPPDRDLHRFLMRDSSNKIVDCRMERLTFGVSSSPYLATQVLRTLADLHSSTHPVAASAINTDFYVDDVLSGADDVQAADHLRRQLFDLLSLAGMTLRQWRSNSNELKALIPQHLLEKDSSPVTLTDKSRAPKALGIHWDVNLDTFHVSIPSSPPSATPITKRSIASGTAGVFDVLGLVAPAIIPARILLQEAWKRSLPWDKTVPDDIKSLWETWIQDLPHINSIAVPRRLTISDSKSLFTSLHGFCDASTVAYGAVLYLRTVAEDGSISTSIVVAKARVLPVKHITIPRAELLGAHLLAKMLAHTSDLLQIPSAHIFAWTDSEIVLRWLPKQSQHLPRFVANRVSAIQDLVTPSAWRHVRSADNPADLASRGVRAPTLASSTLWWSGPTWLRLPPEQWPAPKSPSPLQTVPCLLICSQPPLLHHPSEHSDFINDLWSKFSSFHRLSRVLSWITRFSFNSKRQNKVKMKDPQLSSKEITCSKARLFSISQRLSYPEVFTAIARGHRLPKSHPLFKRSVTISELGYLVSSSRVRDPNSPTQPTLLIPLHSKSGLTKLLVRTLHVTYSHAGISALASIIVSKYYIPNLRNLLKFVSRTCAPCQRAYAVPLTQRMGMLPSSRTTPAPPFDRTGIDFAGPFVIRQGYSRKPVLVKSYAAVFVCMTTKAVHLDLCSSLSTPDFLATLKRFVARRGCPTHIFSDNGTNFVGAREEIRELQKLTESKETREAVVNFAAHHDIEWHHTPPRAPHFGGLWEAAVKSMKALIRKNIAPHALRFEELYTLLTEIEAILNSRPLSPLHSDDVAESTYITAGHFLIGRPLKAAPSPRPSEGKISTLRRWNLVNRLSADLWRQWLSSYLASCAQRSKWTHSGKKPAVGDLVFVKDETLRSRDWPIAVIEKIHPGDDSVVRAVTVRCRGNSYLRSADRLIPLVQDEPTPPTTQNNRLSCDNRPVSSPPRRMSGTSKDSPANRKNKDTLPRS